MWSFTELRQRSPTVIVRDDRPSRELCVVPEVVRGQRRLPVIAPRTGTIADAVH
jgi:hypothetical protein